MTKAITASTKASAKKQGAKFRRVSCAKISRSREYWRFQETFNVAVVAAGAALRDSDYPHEGHEELANNIVVLAAHIAERMNLVLKNKRQFFKLP